MPDFTQKRWPVLIALFPLLILAMGGGLFGCQMKGQAAPCTKPGAAGCQLALAKAMPERPTLLMFTSRYCSTCKAVKPELEKLVASQPGWHWRMLDISNDRAANKDLFAALAPQVAPDVSVIGPDGQLLGRWMAEVPVAEVSAAMQGTSTDATH